MCFSDTSEVKELHDNADSDHSGVNGTFLSYVNPWYSVLAGLSVTNSFINSSVFRIWCPCCHMKSVLHSAGDGGLSAVGVAIASSFRAAI